MTQEELEFFAEVFEEASFIVCQELLLLSTVHQFSQMLQFVVLDKQIVPKFLKPFKDSLIQPQYLLHLHHILSFLQLQQSQQGPDNQIQASNL